MNKDFQYYKNNLNFNNASILITGGTGSFGRAFVNKILTNFFPKRLIIFSRDEHKQYEMQNEYANHPKVKSLRFFIGDVRDRYRLKLATKNVDYLIHAAALKHIPSTEYNPFECIRTNVTGGENIIYSAIHSNIKKVIALSTDKACNPINIYGASKLASDKLFVAGNHLASSVKSKFSVVRYGNVLGSRGSIYWVLKDVMEKKLKTIPITDKSMTRFWINLDQGVEFVISCLNIMQGGEIFIPKIPSMKIIDFVNFLCPKINKKIIGVRPGEKLHETLISIDDARSTIDLKDRYVILPEISGWNRKLYNFHKGKKVKANFEYKSNNNDETLNQSKFKTLIKLI